MTVGSRIKNRRLQLGMSVDDVSERLGKNRATIYRYESDSSENLPITVLEPLAEILETTPAYLMGWSEDPYDYENDPDGRLNEIPYAQYRHLAKVYNNDPEQIWHAWDTIERVTLKESQLDLHPLEIEHLKKYRAIDARGRDMVDTVLDKEYERVQQEDLVEIQLVARSGDNEIIKVTRKEFEEGLKILDEYANDPDTDADEL